MFTVCFHTKFNITYFRGHLVTSVKLKTKLRPPFGRHIGVHTARKHQEVHVFSKMCYDTLFQDPVLCVANVVSTSQFRASAILLLLIIGN